MHIYQQSLFIFIILFFYLPTLYIIYLYLYYLYYYKITYILLDCLSIHFYLCVVFAAFGFLPSASFEKPFTRQMQPCVSKSFMIFINMTCSFFAKRSSSEWRRGLFSSLFLIIYLSLSLLSIEWFYYKYFKLFYLSII